MEVGKHLRRSLVALSRSADRAILPVRFLIRQLRSQREIQAPDLFAAENLPVHFINLASRPDRLRETRDELQRMGLVHWSRFDAIKNDNGALGCALSHARVIEGLKAGESAVMVCEDDIEFLVSPEELRVLVQEFLENPALDVLCIAFRVLAEGHPISSHLAITSNTQTLACYVAKASALDLLKDSFFESAQLIEEGRPLGVVAADQHWKRLQRRGLIFAIPRKRAARQRPSFSDIEGQEVSYGV
jgi:glycosyl transferase family 25